MEGSDTMCRLLFCLIIQSLIYMPFGLKSAAQIFQRLMDSFLQDIGSAFVYLNDILIASSSDKEHIDDLNGVFRRLKEGWLYMGHQWPF